MTQPSFARDEFLAADLLETGVLWGGVASALIAAALASLTMRARSPTAPGVAAVALAIASIGLMSVARHLLRAALTSPYLDVGALPSDTQVGAVIIFFVVLVAGLSTVAYMLWLLRRGRRGLAGSPNEGPS
jgi:hypothetical protein